MRVFFAIDPPAQTKLAIEAWRAKAFPVFERPVRASNFHITLAFLGEISSKQLDSLCQSLDPAINIASFDVELNYLGYWPKPKVLWLGCKHCKPAHTQLVERLLQLSHSAGIALPKRDYIAHLSLVRKCQDNPPSALIEPLFNWRANQFHLFESVSTPKGVVYQRRQTWPLQPNFNFKR